jgi:hypothetical protein
MKKKHARVRFLLVALLSLVGTVSTSPYCAGALMAQAQGQEPVMPPPGGDPDHHPPPKGAYCDRTNRPAHHCDCHIECVDGDDGQVHYAGITQCRAYCHEDHCRCPAKGCKAPNH